MEKHPHTISVVTRLSRDAFYLNRVLAGLSLQTGVNLEWCIVTQTPLSKAHKSILENASLNGIKTHIFKASQNDKLGRLVNHGIKATRSEFILVHDDDDMLVEDFIGPAINLLSKSKYVGMSCYAANINENESRQSLNHVIAPIKNTLNRSDFIKDNKIVTNGFIFKRTDYLKTEGYPEDVEVAEDWLFYLEILKHGDIKVYPKICSYVYTRYGPSLTPQNVNTSRHKHEDMRKNIHIKESFVFNEPKISFFIRARRKACLLVDKFIFSLTRKILPRIKWLHQ